MFHQLTAPGSAHSKKAKKGILVSRDNTPKQHLLGTAVAGVASPGHSSESSGVVPSAAAAGVGTALTGGSAVNDKRSKKGNTGGIKLKIKVIQYI